MPFISILWSRQGVSGEERHRSIYSDSRATKAATTSARRSFHTHTQTNLASFLLNMEAHIWGSPLEWNVSGRQTGT